MMLRLKKFSLFFVVIVLLFGAEKLWAADLVQGNNGLLPARVTLDGKEYTKAELLKDFVNIAFSKQTEKSLGQFSSLSNRPVYPVDFDGSTLLNPKKFKGSYPWFYEYVFRDQGTPPYGVINKWTKPIHISMGFPNDLRPLDEVVTKKETIVGTYLTESDVSVASRRDQVAGKNLSDTIAEKNANDEIQADVPELGLRLNLTRSRLQPSGIRS